MDISKLKLLIETLETLNGSKDPVSTEPTFIKGKHIVILQRGWVVVGDAFQSGSRVTIENASVIRIWGTDKGLGQLALEGPRPNTKLDNCGTVVCHELAIVASIKCEEAKW